MPPTKEYITNEYGELFGQNLTDYEIAQSVGVKEDTIRRYRNIWETTLSPEQTELQSKIVAILKKEKLTAEQLATKFDAKPDVINWAIRAIEDDGHALRRDPYENTVAYYIKITQDDCDLIISPRSHQVKHLKQLWISDIHGGDKGFANMKLFNMMAKAFQDGVRHCFIAGDSVAGINVYRGQMADLSQWDLQSQVDAVVDILSQYPMDYYLIDGNHDESWIKKGAPSPNALIAKGLPNAIYIPTVFS